MARFDGIARAVPAKFKVRQLKAIPLFYSILPRFLVSQIIVAFHRTPCQVIYRCHLNWHRYMAWSYLRMLSYYKIIRSAADFASTSTTRSGLRVTHPGKLGYQQAKNQLTFAVRLVPCPWFSEKKGAKLTRSLDSPELHPTSPVPLSRNQTLVWLPLPQTMSTSGTL